jgi:hypothetical protein
MWIGYALMQIAGMALTLLRMVPLEFRNRRSGNRIPGDGDVVVSLTSHGKRLRHVHFAIESVARGRATTPIVLWLDKGDYEAPWPRSIMRLVERGLQVRCSDGLYGPHTKYWGQFRELAGTERRVVTVDDDVIYPEWFLERLLFIGDLYTDVVVAYRAHRIVLHDGHVQPYLKWSAAASTDASFLHFATGVSGVLYPASFIGFVVDQGEAFRNSCLRADDVWLHACALRSGHRVRQVFRDPRNFAVVPTTQFGALVLGNTLMGGNDAQIACVYTDDDVRKLIAENSASGN